ncbi:MAG: protein translocase SEC61 complex subunit gamma [Candidatus Lokiarchaeota archaeon]|nr:protein translocase SEC61 complex subunit gamma [Candidatus Lokiarchaeota archaeon]
MANFIQNLIKRVKNFWENTKRVYRLSRKPTLHEFRMITRICILGVLVIGFIGYAIQMLFQFLLLPIFADMGATSTVMIDLILEYISVGLSLI